jgi:hypothetical protein
MPPASSCVRATVPPASSCVGFGSFRSCRLCLLFRFGCCGVPFFVYACPSSILYVGHLSGSERLSPPVLRAPGSSCVCFTVPRWPTHRRSAVEVRLGCLALVPLILTCPCSVVVLSRLGCCCLFFLVVGVVVGVAVGVAIGVRVHLLSSEFLIFVLHSSPQFCHLY